MSTFSCPRRRWTSAHAHGQKLFNLTKTLLFSISSPGPFFTKHQRRASEHLAKRMHIRLVYFFLKKIIIIIIRKHLWTFFNFFQGSASSSSVPRGRRSSSTTTWYAFQCPIFRAKFFLKKNLFHISVITMENKNRQSSPTYGEELHKNFKGGQS